MVYDAVAGNITIALTGDAMINRRMSVYQENAFLKLVEILRGADATLANLEQGFHEWEASYGSVTNTSFQVSHPSNLAELKWMGIDAVSTAMNHAWDYGEAGLLASLESLKRYELPQAGSGVNLGEARAPVFLDTARGRVAFHGCGHDAVRARNRICWPRSLRFSWKTGHQRLAQPDNLSRSTGRVREYQAFTTWLEAG